MHTQSHPSILEGGQSQSKQKPHHHSFKNNWPLPWEPGTKSQATNEPNMHDLNKSPFIMKFDFAPVKLLSITSDQNLALFGAMRKIFYMDFDQLLKSKEKIKQSRTKQPTDKLINPDPQIIEGNPVKSSIIASISDHIVSIFDLNDGSYLQTLGCLTSQTSMSWNQKDENQIATGSYDKIRLWDLRTSQASLVILTSQTSKILFDRKNENQFATAHDKIVRIWDQRQTNKEVFHIDTFDNNIKNMDFDYQTSKLLLTSSQGSIRIFQLSETGGEALTHVTLQNPVNTVVFTPFGLGLAVSTEKSNNVKFFSLHERESDGGLFLKKKKYETRNQKEIQLVQELKIFQLRRDPNDYQYQIVSLPSDKYLRIEKLSLEFTDKFQKSQSTLIRINSRQKLLKSDKLNYESSSRSDFQKIITQSDIVLNEFNETEVFEKIVYDLKEMDPQQKGIINRIELRLFLKDKRIFGLTLIIPSNYPKAEVLFKAGNRMNIDDATSNRIIDKINELAHQKAQDGVQHIKTCLQYLELSLKSPLVGSKNQIFNVDDGIEDYIINNQYKPQELKEDANDSIQNEKKYFIPYPRTNGFSWNSRGQLVYFSYSKYNIRTLQDNSKKKIYNATDLKNIYSQISKKFNWTNNNQIQGDYEGDEIRSEDSSDGNDIGSGDSSNDEKFNNYAQNSNNRTSLMQDEDYSDSDDNDDDDEEEEYGVESSYYNKSITDSKRVKSRQDSKSRLKSASGRDTNQNKKYRIKRVPSKNQHIRYDKRISSKRDDNYLINTKPSVIAIYNLDFMFNVDLKFAESQEIFSTDIKELCISNSSRLIELDKHELAKAWNMIAICLSDINSDLFKLQNWSTNPLGKSLAIRLLTTFEEQGDIQNLALLSALMLGSETKILENLMEVQKQAKMQSQIRNKQINSSNIVKTQSYNKIPFNKQLSKSDLHKQPNSFNNLDQTQQVESINQSYKFPTKEVFEKDYTLENSKIAPNQNYIIKVQTPRKNKETHKGRKKSYQYIGGRNHDYFKTDGGDYEWLIKPKQPQNKFKMQANQLGSFENLYNDSRLDQHFNSPQRTKSGQRPGYNSRNLIDEEKLDNHFVQPRASRFKKRKPSTPDNKKNRKPKINLFMKHDVDYLVDKQAIHIKNEGTEELELINLENHKSEKFKNFDELTMREGNEEFEDLETNIGGDQKEEVEISMKEMLLYMKKYAELLLSWGHTFQSIELCKIVAKAEILMLQTSAIKPMSLMNDKDIEQRSQRSRSKQIKLSSHLQSNTNLSIKDYLPFSENSLGYICKKQLQQGKHEENMLLNMGGINQCNSCDKISVKCAICDLNVMGLMFVCIHCYHGGHYEHIKEWFTRKSSKNQSQPNYMIPCPTGCGCTQCFLQI
ncbi:wd repeat-containing protein 59 [Stylonychia lemnae]|uniref:Wd repeat-containing protein 59 n=1 Tax=Stylonychia lemnae TaxID=5949 RepID=A0A078B7G9_STYLE|nr:wd repeat-containing protein 59 [Stylonychia lemnae]|eukprot:CDW89483.1 wd repeat-containing protein 59 [Stylonychia lemnae]